MKQTDCRKCCVCDFKEALCKEDFCQKYYREGRAEDFEKLLPHWIPCSERLPERNQICIVTDETRRCAYEYGLHDETYDNETGWTYLGHKIIAWMPLPAPYKEDKS